MTAAAPPSPVETIKAASRRLRGTLAESLADDLTGALRADDTQLIKFHGSYQQDDRDLREERRAQKLEPAYSFMIRTRTPGGVVTPAQWLALDAIATRYANHTLRLTTRQAFQFHGVVKHALKTTIQAINRSLIDSIAACGDVNRNVMVSPNPVQSRAHAEVYAWACRLSEHLKPQTRAYYELWLDEQRIAGSGEEDEPVYGPVYLPRKFKTALAIPPYNDVDLFANDLGLIAIVEDGVLQGFNVAVGGGLGATHGDVRTYPRLAEVIGFVTPDRLLAVAEAVVTAQRDLGDRSDRKLSRLKYTIDRIGLVAFKAEVERRLGAPLEPERAYAFEHAGDRLGWVEGHDGRWHLGLRIESGRIADRGARRHLSGLRAIARIHEGDFRLTGNQNLIVANVAADAREAIDRLTAEYGLDEHRRAPVRRDALACVALPTCSLAMAEAERYLPDLLDRVEALLAAHDLSDAPLGLRISGCPNGCSRPYLGEIALVGKAPGRYNLMLGADACGRRLNRLHRENVTEGDILAELDRLFGRYAAERRPAERFGDFLLRSGLIAGAAQTRSLP